MPTRRPGSTACGGASRGGKKRKRDRDDEGEKALERQLKGKGERGDDDRDREEDVRAVVVRPGGQDLKGKGREKDAPMTTNGHLNFWAELEDVRPTTASPSPSRLSLLNLTLHQGGQPGSSKLESRLKKVIAAEPDDSLTKVYLAKKGEGEPVGWYASRDGKTERERKETIETTLERTCAPPPPPSLPRSHLFRRDTRSHCSSCRAATATPSPSASRTRSRS